MNALGVPPPIGGPFWSWAVPAALLLVAVAATVFLYRRFSDE